MASSSSKSGAQRSNVRTAKPRTPSGAVGGLLGALIMSVVAGILVTVSVTPVVAISGATATSAIKLFQDLPSHIDPGQLAQPSTIWAKNSAGENVKLTDFFAQNREMVGWDGISQFAKDAAVATEDPQFFTHGGVNVFSLARATVGNIAGTSDAGASTITMQYVRNVKVQETEAIMDPEERQEAYEHEMRQEVDRKIQEIRYAISIEKKFTKNEILTGYLNIANFGGTVYGIEAAAQTYYSKSAKDLTLPEAASLVGIVQFPGELNLLDAENIPANQARRDYVLGRMLDAGRITQEQHDAAVATNVEPKLNFRQQGCAVAETNYALGHFCDYVARYVERLPALGNTDQERHFQFLRGGYDIYTTIDLDLQAAAVSGMRNNVPASLDFMKLGSSLVSVQVGTGRVLAMTQNKPFSADPDVLAANADYTAINYGTDFEDGGSYGFQIGSTAKAFTLTEWLRSGNSLYDRLNGNARDIGSVGFRAHCLEEGMYYSSWDVKNDAGERPGSTTVLEGTAQSLNGVYASMLERLDICDVVDVATKLGIHRAADQEFDDTLPNYGKKDVLVTPNFGFAGTEEIAPISVATAYAAFANQGKSCPPIPIDSITDAEGEAVPFDKAPCTEAISADVAAGVLFGLAGVVNNGTGQHARSYIPRFLKTGTTDYAYDRWNVGGSSKVVTAVWLGNYDSMKDGNGDTYKTSLDRSGLGRAERWVFNSVMEAADAKYGGDAFPDPPRSATTRVTVTVPDVVGLTPDDAKQRLEAAGFGVIVAGEVDSSVPKGRVAAANPSGQADKGADITLTISRGNRTKIPDGLVGATAASAKGTLSSAGFSNVATKCSAGPGSPSNDHLVESVSPASGTEANPSSRVVLSVKCEP